ncbi:MAG: thymidine phosphorylase [Treponema sp. GWB1_62_6]|nr:MAG: thymidine phosphorylase [Treponema sp. GWA1_62_8]OHE66603.1 MAG: thymidine phosphorylase [Treponema sp. GWC1_61_84]OHE67658.1 MAG: thymidine phosphorylase [Treponema sp. GWB1_62_6]OHE72287.1 MAG: thymidine phosphorylase [Treponema sp. RIFOXYC1_FULL_61_9]HCM28276.1 thymidine phosphorylase [Treponema sp.]
MRAVDVIMNKRSGAELTREEIEFLIGGYVAGTIPDYQIAAWAMAVFFRGMTPAETGVLTEVMLRSGTVMDLSGIAGPFVDKHSTGGVGDKTSLVIAPLVASLGIKDPMMSGRALGHTGGTLDKLEAIPGYRTDLTAAEFRDFLSRDGFAMTGQTKEIVPADRLLYSLRDVTGTVESIPLITASILSKKVAEGAEGLVFDVKFGSGAFMKDFADAEKLASSLVDTGAAMGKKVIALLTDMDQPLGTMVGNFLEVEECLDCLEGKGAADLMEVTLELSARMVVLGGKAKDSSEGRRLCEQALATGKPLELFLANVGRQGGDVKRLLELRGSYRSDHSADVRAEESGYLARIDALKVGRAGVSLGVGRDRTQDAVSPVAGVRFHAKGGDRVKAGDPVMTVWGKDDASLKAALPLLRSSIEYSREAPPPRKLVRKEISSI